MPVTSRSRRQRRTRPGNGRRRQPEWSVRGKSSCVSISWEKTLEFAQRIVVPLTQAAAGELAPGESYTVQPGNNLWQISRRAYGAGTRYLIIYSANLGQIRDPERIYPGQVFRVPKS